MNQRILALVATTTFVCGLVVGQYGLPRGRTVMTPLAKNEAAPSSPNSFSQPCPTSQPGRFKSGNSLPASNIINAIENSVAHPTDRNLQDEVGHLIETVDAKDIPAALDAILRLPNQRERNMFISMLISRWASTDPATAGQRALQLPAGPIRDMDLRHHTSHLRPREHQDADAGVPLRCTSDGNVH